MTKTEQPTSIYRMTNEQLRAELAAVEADMIAAMAVGNDRRAISLDNYAMEICSILSA